MTRRQGRISQSLNQFMQRRSSHHEKRRSRGAGSLSPARRLLAALLVVSLWHAPVPWIHAHALRGGDVDHIEQLHRHVDAFHATEIAAGQLRLELHAHLILPWERVPTPDAPGAPHVPGSDDLDYALLSADSGATLSAKSAGAVSPDSFGNLMTSQVIDSFLRQAPESSLRGISCGSHFFETYGCSVSIGDLVSVRLC